MQQRHEGHPRLPPRLAGAGDRRLRRRPDAPAQRARFPGAGGLGGDPGDGRRQPVDPRLLHPPRQRRQRQRPEARWIHRPLLQHRHRLGRRGQPSPPRLPGARRGRLQGRWLHRACSPASRPPRSCWSSHEGRRPPRRVPEGAGRALHLRHAGHPEPADLRLPAAPRRRRHRPLPRPPRVRRHGDGRRLRPRRRRRGRRPHRARPRGQQRLHRAAAGLHRLRPRAPDHRPARLAALRARSRQAVPRPRPDVLLRAHHPLPGDRPHRRRHPARGGAGLPRPAGAAARDGDAGVPPGRGHRAGGRTGGPGPRALASAGTPDEALLRRGGPESGSCLAAGAAGRQRRDHGAGPGTTAGPGREAPGAGGGHPPRQGRPARGPRAGPARHPRLPRTAGGGGRRLHPRRGLPLHLHRHQPVGVPLPAAPDPARSRGR